MMRLQTLRILIVAATVAWLAQFIAVCFSSGWWLVLGGIAVAASAFLVTVLVQAYHHAARVTIPREQFDPFMRRLLAYADSVQRRCSDGLQTVDPDEVKREMAAFERELDAMFERCRDERK